MPARQSIRHRPLGHFQGSSGLLGFSLALTLVLSQGISAEESTTSQPGTAAGAVENKAQANAIESKPLRTINGADLFQEEREVKRLRELLSNYHNNIDNSGSNQLSDEELARRESARRDAQNMAKIPFNVDKVRLSGAEGSTALGQISERLSDATLAESRRDVAPIFSIKTYLEDALMGSENRSLKPVGKHHFVARIRLQPGDTTLRILQYRWEVRLPDNASASDFLVTYYSPPGHAPELHLFSVKELLALEHAHIPAWLPDELEIKPRG